MDKHIIPECLIPFIIELKNSHLSSAKKQLMYCLHMELKQNNKGVDLYIMSNMSARERNYGIDLLRIVSMIMIIVLHLFSHGGILESFKIFSFQYETAWLLEILSFCAVNCFALISGYVGYGHRFKYNKLMYLWFEVFFYSFGLMILAKVFFPSDVSFRLVLLSAFPITSSRYWYFSSYFFVALFAPFFNFVLDKLSKKNAIRLVFTIVFLLSLVSHFPVSKILVGDPFHGMEGYSALWLSGLYLIGGFIKKYGLFNTLSKSKCFALYLVFSVITWISKLIIELLTIRLFGEAKFGEYFVAYNSPTILFSSIFLLLFFAKISVNSKTARIISVIAPTTFGVFLLHEHLLFYKIVYPNLHLFSKYFDSIFVAIVVILMAIIIFICLSLLDSIRIYLFKIIKIDRLCIWLTGKCSYYYNRINNKIIR